MMKQNKPTALLMHIVNVLIVLAFILVIFFLFRYFTQIKYNKPENFAPTRTLSPEGIVSSSPTLDDQSSFTQEPSQFTVTTQCTEQPTFLTYNIIAEYPHDPGAFTQGLVYVDGFFYESTGRYGMSSIRKVDPHTGEITQQYQLSDEFFGEGLTVVDDRIIQLTWKNQIGFVYSKDSFIQESSFSYSTEGWGLTYDGNSLIMSDGSNNLYFLDPIDFSTRMIVSVYDQNIPITRINELEYFEDSIYANIWETENIVRIDPKTGCIKAWINLAEILDTTQIQTPVDVLNGIAFDPVSQNLFITGKLWPKIFEIELIPINE